MYLRNGQEPYPISVNKSDWDHQYFEQKRTEVVLKELLENIKIVAIDKTAISKTGRHFEKQSKVYDSRIDGLCDGFPLLVAAGISERNHYSLISHLRYNSHKVKQCSENLIKHTFISGVISLFKESLKSLYLQLILGFV